MKRLPAFFLSLPRRSKIFNKSAADAEAVKAGDAVIIAVSPQIDRETLQDKTLDLVCDNCATHKHPNVKNRTKHYTSHW